MQIQNDEAVIKEMRRICRTCKEIFVGKAEQGPVKGTYWHHQSFYSFSVAQKNCRLCFELWNEWQRQSLPTQEDIFVLCLAGTEVDSHPNRTINVVQFDVYSRFLNPIEKDQYLFNQLGISKPRVIQQHGAQYARTFILCFELTQLAGLPVPREANEIGYHSKDYPSQRILYVGEKGEKFIRLHLRDKSDIKHAPYATLSYRWGSGPPMKLTTDTFRDLVSGILPSSLPKTFRNAIALVREFGIRYLWIDSLCILQDSLEDWQKQGAVMGQIYKSCALCLAATSATSCGGGLFFERDPYLLQPVHVFGRWPFYDTSQPLAWYTCFVQAPYSNNIMSAPLNTRGWVLQERLLAPRILHCTEKEFIWECNEMIASETFPRGVHAGLDHHPTDRLVPLLGSTTQEKHQDYAYDTWMKIVKEYSKCILTKEDDILTALSGIAQEWQRALDDTYLAGLWKKTLHVGLLW